MSREHESASPPSPTASFYDVSDDEEGGYSAIKRSKTDKGVKLLYAKSKVYVHPSASAKENVAGYIALVEQKPTAGDSRRKSSVTHPTASVGSSNDRNLSENNHNILLCWLPETSVGDANEKYAKADMSEVDTPPHRPDLVPPPPMTTTHGGSVGAHPFSVPLSEIYSVLFRPPSSGWWHGSIVVNSRAGESFPALFFHDNECQSTINARKRLQRETFDIGSSSGGGMHWGGDEIMKWFKKHANVERSAHEPSLYLIDPSADDAKAFGLTRRPTTDNVRNMLEGTDKNDQSKQKKKEDPFGKALKEARWTILEKLSQVTTFTRKTAQSVQENKNLPPGIRRLMQSPQVQSMGDEFDSARLYLARWAMSIAEQAEKERSERIWTARDILEMEESELGSFEVLDAEMLSLQDKRNPVTMEEWKSFFNVRTGRLEKTQLEVKERIFHGGLSKDDDVRKEAWLFLLGVYEWDSSEDERRAKMHSLRDEYIRLKGAWWERLADDGGSLEEKEWWKEQRMRIGKFEFQSLHEGGLPQLTPLLIMLSPL